MAEIKEVFEKAESWLESGKASADEIKQLLPLVKKLTAGRGITQALFDEAGGTEESAELLELAAQIESRALAAEEIKSAMLERLAGSAAKDSGQSVTDQSLLTKMLLRSSDTGKISIGNKDGIEKQAQAQIQGEPLNLIEYNALRSIVSYQLDSEAMNEKQITLTASQIYNKMRRGKGSGKVNKSQQAEIHEVMQGLERRIKIWLNEGAADWLGIHESKIKNMRILHFDFDEGYINGQRAEYYYTIYNVGLLQEIAYKAGQLERIPQEVLAIEQHKDGTWKRWTLSKKRIELRTVLELFYFQILRSPSIISNKKPYADIFSACEIGEHREKQKRAKEDIRTILDYWQRLGLFESWNEYGNGRGIELHFNKGGADNGLLSSENA